MSNGRGLSRELGLFTATCIVVANMIGSGIFTTSGVMSARLPGPWWVLGCWFLGGCIAAAGALSFAELATRMPKAGGEYVYLHRIYGPLPAFLTGWTSFFVGFSAPIALSAFGFTEYLFAGLTSRFQIDPGTIEIGKKLLATAIIAVFTALHYLGLRLGARVQNYLTILKVGILFSLVALILTVGSGSWSNYAVTESSAAGGWAFGSAMMMVLFAYSGWNASAYIAGELRKPRRTLPLSLLIGTAIVTVLYLLLNGMIFYAAPYDALKGKIAVVERAAVWGLGSWAADLFSGMVGVAMLSSLSAFVLIGPRIYYAMARDRLFLPFAGDVHERYGVPGKAIVVQGAVAILMVMLGTFEQLLLYVGFALGIFPWLAIAGLFIARRKRIGEENAYKAWGYPVIPLFYLICSSVLMTIAYMDRPFESTAAIISVLVGVPIYYLWVSGLGAKRNTVD